MDTSVVWVDVREGLPNDGMPVAAATTGRYPIDDEAGAQDESARDFWLVMPMVFATRHVDADGTEHHDCFVDSDRVVRLPYGRPCAEPVTHWASLPTLPGTTVHTLLGEHVRPALHEALGQ
ncbi:AQJ64_40280 family protein [Embleya sp. NPDC056575]|uniref:AQJ64_40280 family protein n=1 Tax=unclassified Embleya TaxID=2699296 RepID=UPI00367B02A1